MWEAARSSAIPPKEVRNERPGTASLDRRNDPDRQRPQQEREQHAHGEQDDGVIRFDWLAASQGPMFGMNSGRW
jgi:hypothetical protein